VVPVPAVDAQCLEKEHRSAGEHLKGKTKEFQPIRPASQLHGEAQLQCLYANTHSMGNKQEEIDMCPHMQGYDLIGITETSWDDSCD